VVEAPDAMMILGRGNGGTAAERNAWGWRPLALTTTAHGMTAAGKRSDSKGSFPRQD